LRGTPNRIALVGIDSISLVVTDVFEV